MELLKSGISGTLIFVLSFLGWNVEETKTPLPETPPGKQKTEKIIETPVLPKKQIPPQPKTPEKPWVVPTKTLQTETQTPEPFTRAEEVNKETNSNSKKYDKEAVANILCGERIGSQIKYHTGSAVAISNEGVLITNAHVAEYVLLSEFGGSDFFCEVRAGSPASPAYKAKMLFMPSLWINANKNNLKYDSLSGTGENDYALIYLSEKTKNSTSSLLPTEINLSGITKNQNIFISAYPAGFSSTNILLSSLSKANTNSKIKSIWPLGSARSAVFDTEPTLLAAGGASGGGIFAGSQLIGIIGAVVIDKETTKPAIRGISLEYISNQIKSESDKELSEFLKNPESTAGKFKSDFEKYTKTLLTNR